VALLPKSETHTPYPKPQTLHQVYRTVALLPKSEMEETLEKEGNIEVKCEFCKRKYSLSGKELEEVYKQVGK